MAAPGWGSLRADLEADVRRVSDRLRSLSGARLAAPPAAPAPPDPDGPPYPSRAQAGRAAANALAAAAQALEAAAEGVPQVRHDRRDLPTLSDFAVGDQVAVTGKDLLAAMQRVLPETPVSTSTDSDLAAADAVASAARVLADVRRRI